VTSSAPTCDALRINPLICAAVCSICCWIPPPAAGIEDDVSVDPVDVADPLLLSTGSPPVMPLTMLGRDPRCLSFQRENKTSSQWVMKESDKWMKMDSNREQYE
jgi:hypothetical protein